jgi:hypothetical protein
MIEKKIVPPKTFVLEYIIINEEQKTKKERLLFDNTNFNLMKSIVKEYKKNGTMTFMFMEDNKISQKTIYPIAISTYKVLEYYTKINENE